MNHEYCYFKGNKKSNVKTANYYLKLDSKHFPEQPKCRQIHVENKENVKFTNDSPYIDKKKINNLKCNKHKSICSSTKKEAPSNIVNNQESCLLREFFNLMQCLC